MSYFGVKVPQKFLFAILLVPKNLRRCLKKEGEKDVIAQGEVNYFIHFSSAKSNSNGNAKKKITFIYMFC